MDRTRWLVVIALAGVAILALSFIEGWIVHDRELRGEGYRHVQIFLSAWRSVAVPVLSLGVFAAVATAIGAAISLRRASILGGWPLLAGSVLALALIGASIVPIVKHGHASSIALTVGWATGIGVGLAVLMVVGAAKVGRPRRRLAVALGMVGILALAGAAGGRWLGLQWKEGTGRHWSDGSYTRPATAGEERETLTINAGSFEIADRWAGSWESSGWTVVLVDDPACPDSRGTYHAHGEGETGDDLRFVMVVDTCRDGARAADLETGIWERDP